MNSQDFSQVAAWAGATAVVTLMAMGGSAVKSDYRILNGRGVARIAGNEIAATAGPGEQPETVALKLEIANPGNKPTANAFRVTVVKRDFKGNAISRVAMPSDFSQRTVAAESVLANLDPGKTATFTITLTRQQLAPSYRSQPGPAGAKPIMVISSSYEVEIAQGKSVRLAAAFSGQILDAKARSRISASPATKRSNRGSSSAPGGTPTNATRI